MHVAIMFVQATQSRRQNKTYVSYLVRESFRTPQGPRSRTVCNISALPPEVRDLIAQALSGKSCVALEECGEPNCFVGLASKYFVGKRVFGQTVSWVRGR